VSTRGESVDVATTLSDDVVGSDEANVDEGNSVKESEASEEDVDEGNSVKDNEVSEESVDALLVSVDAAFAPSSRVVSDEEAEETVADAWCAVDSVKEVSGSRMAVLALVKSPAGDPVVVMPSLEESEVASRVDDPPLLLLCVTASVDVVVSEPNVSLGVVPKDDVSTAASLSLALTVDVDASSEAVWVLTAFEMALEVDSTTPSEADMDVSSVVV
jgi:hypothetical protein